MLQVHHHRPHRKRTCRNEDHALRPNIPGLVQRDALASQLEDTIDLDVGQALYYYHLATSEQSTIEADLDRLPRQAIQSKN